MNTKTHTVSCRSYHPAARPWQQYVGAIAWESITDVACDPSDLSDPLARFLAENARHSAQAAARTAITPSASGVSMG